MRAKRLLVLTKRDLNILRFAFEQRVVAQTQIIDRFFKDVTFQIAYRRIKKLVVADCLIKSASIWRDKTVIFYGLSDAGFKIIAKNFKFEITRPLFKSDSIQHDIGLGPVRCRIEKTRMLEDYFSENVLQSCGAFTESEKFKPFVDLNSDAALVLKTPTGLFRVALEYESSEKQVSRYSKKLLEYYLSPRIAAVFYVCGNERIERIIRQVDMELSAKLEPKVYTCLESVILQTQTALPFINQKNAIFLLE